MSPSWEETVAAAKERVREIDPTEAKELAEGQGAIILDVREPHEWDDAHIEGAILVPLGQLQSAADPNSPSADPRLTEHKGTPIVAQCETGKRSAVAADILMNLGYENVSSMTGGILFWARKGYPID
ncbi:MAG: rhodanese-like domain-containing protein [Actinomycetota bacterium]